ncbi:hypothetical protein M2318_003537 [Metapseudomonas resinovorans]
MSTCLGFAILLTLYGLASSLLKAWSERSH